MSILFSNVTNRFEHFSKLYLVQSTLASRGGSFRKPGPDDDVLVAGRKSEGKICKKKKRKLGFGGDRMV